MKCSKIAIKNFRLLKDTTIDLEDELSLVIGKNNVGKTSLLLVLKNFLETSSTFSFDDFSLSFQDELKNFMDNPDDTVSINLWEEIPVKGIEMILYIEYDDHDSLANISSLMLDLEESNHSVAIKFQYALSMESFKKLREDYWEFKEKTKSGEIDLFKKFVRKNLSKYFKQERYAVLPDEIIKKFEKEQKHFQKHRLLDNHFDFSKILNFKYISAKRESANKESDNSLSALSNRYYTLVKSEDDIALKAQALIANTDQEFDKVYEEIFKDVISDIRQFGCYVHEKMQITIQSRIDENDLLKNNASLVYESNNHNQLPESFNGLGYLNLINIIIQIEIALNNFKNRKNGQDPADINLLFIEEPEAHTHPQMQYVFISNIKNMLLQNSQSEPAINLQTILSTHSSHIVSQCDFEDVKYFHKSEDNVASLNLKDLKIKYKGKESAWKFLKQYLTLNRSELFFADKAILYEGDTERILLPAMMKKIDDEDDSEGGRPLLSQNISMIAVGAHSHIFDEMIKFLGIKTLIITDLDSAGADKKRCTVDQGIHTTNESLKYYFKNQLDDSEKELSNLRQLKCENKVLSKKGDTWVNDEKGSLMVAYQTKEIAGKKSYEPRSFEDAFIFINREFLAKYIDNFQDVTHKDRFKKVENGKYKYDSYKLAEYCKNAKASFAMDILVNSYGNDDISWAIPPYIKEGLKWLKKD